jgi:tetratricopeptide (TPR) repeat protein
MKTINCLVFFLLIGQLAFPQVNRYDRPAPATFKSTYVSPDFNLMMKVLNDKQAAYDQNKNYIDALINWIYDLKSKTNDKQFIESMDLYYKRLREFDNQDLSLMSNNIRQVELSIKEEIDKYNTRVKEANDPSKYWDAGVENLKNQDFTSAIQNFGFVIQLSPDFEGSYFYRGYTYYCTENMSLAITDFTKYIEMSRNDPKGYYYRGWAKYKQGEFMGALADFNKQIELEPASAIAYYNRGSAKSELKDEYGAINDYKKAIELDPSFSMAYNNLGWAKFNLKKIEEALVDVNKAIELDNTNSVAYDSRAEIKFNMNDNKGCIEDSDIALSLNPNISNSYFLKGRSFYKLGKKEEACINWSKAGELGKTEAYEYIRKYCNN